MKHLYIICLVLLSTFGKSQVFHFQTINQEQGLPSSVATCLIQDSRNLIWIGTDGAGLVKYDGTNYKIYDENHGLKGAFITDIAEDANSNLIISTKYDGIFVFDGYKFFKEFSTKKNKIKSNNFYKLITATSGVYAVGEQEIVLIKSNYTSEIVALNADIYKEVNSVALDSKNNLLIGANNGLFSLNNKTIKRIFQNELNNYVSVCKNNTNEIIVSSIKGSLYKLKVDVTDVSNYNISKISDLPFGFNPKRLFVSKRGAFWLGGSDKQGLLMYSGKVFSSFNKSNGFNGENILCFMQDKARNLYIGTEGFGLFKTGPQLFVSYNNHEALISPMIFSIFKDENLYIGIRKDGIYKFTENTQGSFEIENVFKNNVGANVFYKNNKKQVLAGTKEGLFLIENNNLKNIHLSFLRAEKSIVSIKQDSQNRYFIGTAGDGLYVTDTDFKLITHLTGSDSGNFAFYIYTLDNFETNKWYVGTNNGLYIITEVGKNKFTISNRLVESVTSVSTKDSYGNCWFTGSGFIYTYSQRTGVKKYNRKNGLTSTLVYTLIADKNGNLWAGSNLGVDKIKLNKEGEIVSIKNYNFKNGFKGLETNTRAQFIDEEGNLYLGTTKGLSKCIANYTLKTDTLKPTVVITNIKKNNQHTVWNVKNNNWANIPGDGYQFNTNENQLTFQYNIINTFLPDNFYYRYKLEGADKNWSNASEISETSFANLSSGNYAFKVKIVDALGNDLSNITSFPFSIKAPYYYSWWFVLGIAILFFVLFYFLFKKSTTYNKSFVTGYNEVENDASQIRFYFLILGILFPITEVFIEIFKVRQHSELVSNIIFGVAFISLYFITQYNNIFKQKINLIFVIMFLVIIFDTIYKTIYHPFELINFTEFLIALFFSYTVFKEIKYFLIFASIVFLIFSSLFFTHLLEFNLIFIHLNAILVLSILSYARHQTVLNSKEKLVFANNIINNGSSLTIATNKLGEVKYCSENITKILGYNSNEVLGMKFWNLTQHKEFDVSDYRAKFLVDKIYTRKLKCKTGEYKFIQWTDTKYSDDLYVGTGQDVTEQIAIQEQYKNIVQNATDIIYEADANGNFVFVNESINHILEIKPIELLGKHFTTLVRKDYQKKVALFYYKLPTNTNDYTVLEFPVVNNENKEFWVSQKVNVKRDDGGNIISYSAIVRDITLLKTIELNKLKRQKKSTLFSTTITELITNPNSASLSFEDALHLILIKVASTLEIDRISVWKHLGNKIESIACYNTIDQTFSNDEVLIQQKFPVYFATLKSGNIIVADNVCETEQTKEFCNLSDYPLTSLLDVPIYTNGLLTGLLCCENYTCEKKWDFEDITFAKSIADIISILIETQKRKNAELAIIESERNFRLLNETIDDVFWLYDIEKQKILYISPSSQKVLGAAPEVFYNSNHYWVNYIFEEDKPNILLAHQKLLTDEYYEIEYRIKSEEGIKWIFEKSFGIKNEEGIVTKNSGICTDITEKKKVETQLKQLSVVAEKTSNGILISDKEGKVIWANQGYLDMFEISIKDLIGNRPRDLFSTNDNELLNDIEAINGTNFTKEIKIHTYLKKEKWIESNNTVILNNKGEVEQQIEVLTDITSKIQNQTILLKQSKDLEYQSAFQKKLINAYTLRDLTTEVLEFIHSKTPNCAQISLFNFDNRTSYLSGYTYNKKFNKIVLNASDTRSFQTLKTGKIYVETNLNALENKNKFDLEEIEAGITSYIILPILKNEDLIGTLNICFNEPFTLEENEIAILKSFTDLLSISFQQMELKNELYEKDKDHTDSLTYAQNIQNTILPEIKNMTNTFSDVCLYFKPRDIVSGDFYWAKEFNELTFIAIADCTGHGVPGAFLTLIGSRILEQIVTIEKIIDPSEILTKLDSQIYQSLNRKNDEIVRDGMEIALCVIDRKTKTIKFAGAGLGIIYFLNNEEFYHKGQRKSIGDYRHDDFNFETKIINYIGNETFYMATDGYQDQLGGENYKRFSKKRTIELLRQAINLPSSEKEELLHKEITNFIGKNNQTDDITVLGFKLN